MPENENIGKYPLLKLLGSGGMGEVWLSRHPNFEIPVAVKILKTDNDSARQRFIQEGKLAASINHQNIVRVFDSGCENEKFYLVMEFIEGEDYKSVAERNGGKLSIDETVKMGISICEALSIAHKNKILHRDIKPENILLSKAGDIKLTDLGIAKQEDSINAQTIENTALGTPYYISPEQARDASSVDKRTDIYSLGASLYLLLTGTYPFNAKTPIQMLMKHINEKLDDPAQRNSSIPPELSKIICKMMEKETEKRYQNCQEVINDLKEFQKTKSFNQMQTMDAEQMQTMDAEQMQTMDAEQMQVAEDRSFGENNEEIPDSVKNGSGMSIRLIIAILIILVAAAFSIFKGNIDKSDKRSDSRAQLSENKTINVPEQFKELKPFVNRIPVEFNVRISGNDNNEFTEGEKMTFEISSEKDTYIAVIAHQSDGSSVLLLPNRLETNNFIEAGSFIKVPSDKFDITVQAPFGKDLVHVIACTDKQFLNVLLKNTGKADIQGTYLSSLERKRMGDFQTLEKGVFSQAILEITTKKFNE